MNNLNINSSDDLEKIIGFIPDTATSNKLTLSLYQQVAEDLRRPLLFKIEQYSSFELKDVLSYLKMSHEFYLSKKLPEIEQQLTHVYTKFSEYKLFRILHMFFQEYKTHLVEHIEREENTIFKYVDLLLSTNCAPSEEHRFYFLQGSPSLNHFLANHSDTEQDLSAMRKVLKSENNYKQLHPISMLLNQLASLENHLNIHARIEDEVFVPKVLKLEKEFII